MKPLFIAPPLLALAGSAIWLSLQHREISALAEQSRILSARISDAKALPADGPDGRASGARAKKAIPAPFLKDGNIDWVALSKLTVENQGGMPKNIKTFIKVQQKLLSMETKDLQKALKLFARLDLPPQNRQALEMMLTNIIVQKDPQAALKAFESRLSGNATGAHYQMRNAFGAWAKNDPIAALAWFDQKKASGAFESTKLSPNANRSRDFEAQALSALLASDPAQVDARLTDRSKEEVRDLLADSYLWSASAKQDEGSQAYLKLVRRHLDLSDRNEVIGNSIALAVMRDDDLNQVSEKLAVSELTVSERNSALDQVAKHYARPWNRQPADLRALYVWEQEEEPARAAELAAMTFAQFGNHRNTDFEATFREISEIATETENPKILTAFAANLARPDQQLEQIKDETLRGSLEEILDRLAKKNTSSAQTTEAVEVIEVATPVSK